jgi:hypothetical protein
MACRSRHGRARECDASCREGLGEREAVEERFGDHPAPCVRLGSGD